VFFVAKTSLAVICEHIVKLPELHLRRCARVLVFPLLVSTSTRAAAQPAQVSIIPAPSSVTLRSGAFTLSAATPVFVDDLSPVAKDAAELFVATVNRATGFALQAETPVPATLPRASVVFSLRHAGAALGPEAYELEVTPDRVRARATDPRALFYAAQTLLQLLPPEIFAAGPAPAPRSEPAVKEPAWTIPCIAIKDQPRFRYRGMHLDVSRHFFPVSFIKRYIDLIAMHKMNVFHWHLADDNGWRLEIKKYPELTAVSAWRVDRETMPWRARAPARPGEERTYGGFYTQDQVRDVVGYAARHGVMIIPEIEMPGHTSEVFTAYPQLSCTGNRPPVRIGAESPNTDIFCAGNEAVFTFLADVLDEVVALFPGPYIHIGGDEVDKTSWRQCAKCRERMRSDALADADELQSYFVKRIEKLLDARGKRLIGWDEILAGGLSPGATVMSWRGVAGGIAAAQAGHDVIMTPEDPCYFDHYQGDPEDEPAAIGGYTPLRQVYAFEPIPAALSPTQAQHVLGAQGNLWTEYIGTPAHAEYMTVPRISALAEVVWSAAAQRSWPDFRRRLEVHLQRLDELGVNYSRGSTRVETQTQYDPATATITLSFWNERPQAEIRYTQDQTEPKPQSPRYQSPVSIKKPTAVRAALFEDARRQGHVTDIPIYPHAAMGARRQYRLPFDGGDSEERMPFDGILGTLNPADGRWQGYDGSDLDVVLDFGGTVPLHGVLVGFLKNPMLRILPAKSVEISLSADGKDFAPVEGGRFEERQTNGSASILELGVQAKQGAQARFVRVTAHNWHRVPVGYAKAGASCWMLVDEIIVH